MKNMLIHLWLAISKYVRMCPKTEEDMDYMSQVPYVSLVRSLIDEMMCTRPHISHLMGVVRRYMDNLGKEN